MNKDLEKTSHEFKEYNEKMYGSGLNELSDEVYEIALKTDTYFRGNQNEFPDSPDYSETETITASEYISFIESMGYFDDRTWYSPDKTMKLVRSFDIKDKPQG